MVLLPLPHSQSYPEEEGEEEEEEEENSAGEDQDLLIAAEKEISNAAATVVEFGSSPRPGKNVQIQNEIQNQDERGSKMNLSFQAIRDELGKQWRLGLPIAAMNLIWFFKFLATTLFLRRLGNPAELAGGTLGLNIANLSGYSILLGLAAGMEPICSQAFGAGRMDLMSATLLPSIVLLLVVALPITVVWLRIEKFLLFLDQDPSIAAAAARFLRFLVPDLLLQAAIYPIRIFLRCRGETMPMAVASAAGILLQIAIGFVLHRRFRGPGIALAMGIADLAALAVLLSFVLLKNPKTERTKKKRWKWKPLMNLALPSCAMICLEWWCYEIILFLSGLLNDPHNTVPAAAILLNCDALLYSIQITLASCASTRIGHELGANSPSAAGTAAIASLSAGTAAGFATLVAMVTLRSTWGRFFSDDPAVVKEVWRSMPVMGAIELANFVLMALCGILRGSARPAAGAVAILGSFYVIGLPCGVVMGFGVGLGLAGSRGCGWGCWLQ